MTAYLNFGDGLLWRKATRSGGQGGNCVAIASTTNGRVGVRDSKLGASGPQQRYDSTAWATFLAATKADTFAA